MEDLKIILQGLKGWKTMTWRGRVGLVVLVSIIVAQIAIVVTAVYYGSKL